MNEVKSPKKPLVYYYAIVILVILALNFLAVPWLSQRQVKEVDYGTFMTMTENQEIGPSCMVRMRRTSLHASSYRERTF